MSREAAGRDRNVITPPPPINIDRVVRFYPWAVKSRVRALRDSHIWALITEEQGRTEGILGGDKVAFRADHTVKVLTGAARSLGSVCVCLSKCRMTEWARSNPEMWQIGFQRIRQQVRAWPKSLSWWIDWGVKESQWARWSSENKLWRGVLVSSTARCTVDFVVREKWIMAFIKWRRAEPCVV